MYEHLWRWGNKLRMLFGHKPVARRCCLKSTNLVAGVTGRPDLAVAVCQVCGSRHFELTVNPGKVGLRGARL